APSAGLSPLPLPDALPISDGVLAAGDGAGDGAGLHPVAGDADVHLGRGADEVLALAEVDDELVRGRVALAQAAVEGRRVGADGRSEEHTSELQSRENIVCR